jgi:ribosome-associated protein
MTDNILTCIESSLDDAKALEITIIPVTSLTSEFDHMIICTATSLRHAQSIADKTSLALKAIDINVPRHKGKEDDWLILDCGSQVVHIMLEDARNFYALEKLWQYSENLGEAPAS